MKPVLLDLYCKAGGCTKGYQRAGFHVVGVDIEPQPNYCGDEFHQADAVWFCTQRGGEFDCLHASPPCQEYSMVSIHARRSGKSYPDLIEPTRAALKSTGRPYVIENVVGAPLIRPFMLCGSMFGLDVQRHRLFESNVLILVPECQHHRWTPRFRSLDKRQKTLAKVIGNHGHLNYPGEKELRERAMGIDWMSTVELTQAIPPAYTEFIGRQLIKYIGIRSNKVMHRTPDHAGLILGASSSSLAACSGAGDDQR